MTSLEATETSVCERTQASPFLWQCCPLIQWEFPASDLREGQALFCAFRCASHRPRGALTLPRFPGAPATSLRTAAIGVDFGSPLSMLIVTIEQSKVISERGVLGSTSRPYVS